MFGKTNIFVMQFNFDAILIERKIITWKLCIKYLCMKIRSATIIIERKFSEIFRRKSHFTKNFYNITKDPGIDVGETFSKSNMPDDAFNVNPLSTFDIQ